MGNKLKIKTLPTPVEGLYVTPVVTPEAVQGEKSSFPDLPDGSASEVTDLKAYLDKLEHYLTDLKSKLDNRVVKIELPEWDSNNPTTTGVQTKHVADGAINSAKIANGSIQGTDIADGAIDSAKIANGSIQGADIAGGTITRSNLNNGIFSPYLIGRNEGVDLNSAPGWDVSSFSWLILGVEVMDPDTAKRRIIATTWLPIINNDFFRDSVGYPHSASYRDMSYKYSVQAELYFGGDNNNKKYCKISVNSQETDHGAFVRHQNENAILYGIK